MEVLHEEEGNFCIDSYPGCYVALDELSDWIVESGKFDPIIFGSNLNNLLLDLSSGLLSVINTDKILWK